MGSITGQGEKLLIVQSVCIGLVSIVAILRVSSRCYTMYRDRLRYRDLHWREDALMGAAVLLYATLSYFALEGILSGGIGKHVSTISLDELRISFRSWFVCELIYGPLGALIRTSVALLLFRLQLSYWEKRALWICLVIVYTFTVIYFLITLLQCNPPTYFWKRFDGSGMSGSCQDPHRLPAAAYCHSAIAALSDWFITTLYIWKLTQNRAIINAGSRVGFDKTRITILVLVSFGILAGAAMIIRVPYIRDLDVSPDFLYQTVDVAMWSIIEPCVGIVAGSLPSIRPLFLLCYGGPEKGSKTTTTSSGSSRDASQTSTARSNSEGLSLDSSLPFIQRLWPLHKWRWNARGDTKMTAATKERETELGGVWTQTTVEISAVNCATVKPSERSSVVWTEVEK